MRFWLVLILALFAAASARAFVTLAPLVEPLRLAPIERVLANLGKPDPEHLTEPERLRALGRLHLLAYLRQTGMSETPRDNPADLLVTRSQTCRNGAIMVERARPDAPIRDLCARRSAPLDPLSAEAHLESSIAAFAAAVRLEPENLRSRLAYAFALQQAGRTDAAREQLRLCLKQSLAAPVQAEYPLDEALTYREILNQFRPLADPEDWAGLNELARRVGPERLETTITPILVPLGSSDALPTLIDRASPVRFDFSGQRQPMRAGWITPAAAWLVWDPRREGRITTGFQLFGSVTWVSFWDDGYRPLGALDDNHDGSLTGRELAGLALWRDADADGVSDPGEVTPVDEAGIIALAYNHQRIGEGVWISPRGVTFANGRTRPTYDWTVRGRIAPAT